MAANCAFSVPLRQGALPQMQKGNAAATAAFSLTGCRQHAANSRPGIVWASLHAGRRTLRSPHSSQGDAARCGGRFIRPVTSRAVECSAVQQSAAPSCCRHRRAQGICCAAASSTCTDVRMPLHHSSVFSTEVHGNLNITLITS